MDFKLTESERDSLKHSIQIMERYREKLTALQLERIGHWAAVPYDVDDAIDIMIHWIEGIDEKNSI